MNFDDFEVGAHLGSIELKLDPPLIEEWRRLFPRAPARSDRALIPLGYVSVITMRAYMQACKIRPPGNIHGEQTYEIFRLPDIASTVVTEVSCLDKEIKRGRRWLTFGTRTRDSDGATLFMGAMKIAWAR